MQTYTTTRRVPNTQTQVLSFVKENGIWYADLPEFLEAGLGTKTNLMMVDGADTFLDLLAEGNHPSHGAGRQFDYEQGQYINTKYCHYDEAHNDYLYQDCWVDFLVGNLTTGQLKKEFLEATF
jgi:hypothetical protein